MTAVTTLYHERPDFDNQIIEEVSALRHYALRLTANEDDASDLIQDTLLKALHNREKYKDANNLGGWLYTIMKNCFINKYRHVCRSEKILAIHSMLNSEASTYNKGELILLAQEIKKALNVLPAELYNPFIMYFQGYHYKEIADISNIPLGTVKTRIHAARKVLQRILKSHSVNRKK